MKEAANRMIYSSLERLATTCARCFFSLIRDHRKKTDGSYLETKQSNLTKYRVRNKKAHSDRGRIFNFPRKTFAASVEITAVKPRGAM